MQFPINNFQVSMLNTFSTISNLNLKVKKGNGKGEIGIFLLLICPIATASLQLETLFSNRMGQHHIPVDPPKPI
jgi:hypothetical protein